MNKWIFLIFSSLIFITNIHADNIPPACDASNTMVALIDRPSVAFSACPIPQKTLFIESGYEYQSIIPTGHAHAFPQTELRIGLPQNTEIDIFPPSFTQQYSPTQSGFSEYSIGLKRAMYFDANQLFTLQGYISPASGNQNYGADKIGFLINGIYNYNFNSGISLSTTLGLASVAAAPSTPGNNYYSFNPIITIGFPSMHNISPYVEVYSQSKTAIDQNWGVSCDGGLILLVKNNITVDVSAGQKISGALNNIERYVGAGAVLRLG
jgi:hypothetical protein